jgi:outer membrane immunogenic protein
MNKLAVSVLALSLLATPTMAADLLAPPPGVVVDESGFDWDGAFAGLYGAALFGSPITPSYGAGVFVGANATSDQFLVGGIISGGGFIGGAMDQEWIIQAVGRAGVIVSDNIALYALAGIGYETENDGFYVPVGGGFEIALTDDVSWRTQYQADYVVDQNIWVHSISTGVAFHF